MSKVTKTTEPYIELFDTDRKDHDVVYHYVTSAMSDSSPALRMQITGAELEEFVKDYELNQFQTDVDDFKSYDAWDYLMDNWEDVKDKYWQDVLQPRLESNLRQFIAYVDAYIEKNKIKDYRMAVKMARQEFGRVA